MRTLARTSDFIAKTIYRANNIAASYHVGAETFSAEWETKEKRLTAKHLTLNTLVSTPYDRREPGPFDKNRARHPAVKYLTSKFYNPTLKDAIDNIPIHCPEHLMAMRMAVAISRNPDKNSLEVLHVVARQLCKLLSNLDKKTLKCIFTIGANLQESRSVDLINEIDEWKKNLTNYEMLPPNKLLRILETVISPLGSIINTFNTNYCLIKKAEKEMKETGHLEDFILSIIDDFKPFHVPYIKGKDGPFFHLTTKQYIDGDPLSKYETVTLCHFLENCLDFGNIANSVEAKVPILRQVLINDPTLRTHILHVGFNIPHCFDVSGTTGCVIQVIMGLLREAKQEQLLASPENFRKFGMIFAGCNFTKQGFHNFYEVFPALEWARENIFPNQRGEYGLAPKTLIIATNDLLKKCVNSTSNMAEIIKDSADICTEHSIEHFNLYRKIMSGELRMKHLDLERKEKLQDAEPPRPKY